jgi:predicted AAA+ superfamily ATPase
VPASVPTGYEEFITMFPMDFEEYLWAEGYNADAIELLEDYYQSANTIPSAINNKYLQLFREFIVVGGMPEVVKAYVANHDFNEVTKVQKQILDNYRFDISKHAKGAEKIKVQACYEAIPKQLAKEIKKFQY